MRIGIASNIDTKTLLPYLSNETDKKLIQDNCIQNSAPAVNTLILSFLKAGHFIRVFTIAAKEFIIKSPKLEIYAIPSYKKYPMKYLWGVFKNAHSLKVIMQNHLSDLDVLHAHWTYEYAYAASKYSTLLPVFCTVRDIASYIWKIESLKNKVTWTFKVYMNHLVFHNGDIHFIANSPYTAAVIQKKHKIKAPIIPNSIKDSFIKQDNHQNPPTFTILCISSSNDKRKNIIALLKAYKLFRIKYPSALLKLIGPPFIEENKTIKKWEKQGLLDSVELMGAIDHQKLITFLDNSSVFVTPSLEETFGNTLLESIVRKVPVIGGENSGAVPYVLHHGEAGYLCDVSNPNKIYNVLEYILQNPQAASQKAQKAFDTIISEYTESVVCKKHIDLYQQFNHK